MASGGTALEQQVARIQQRLEFLVRRDLKEICKGEGLPVSGVKATLQCRIKKFLHNLVSTNNTYGIAKLLYRVDHRGFGPPSDWVPPPLSNPSAGQNSQALSHDNSSRNSVGADVSSRVTYSIQFNESPFYEIKEQVMPTLELPASYNRSNVNRDFYLTPEVANQLLAEPSFRIMIYCASAPSLGPFSRSDITFPQQMEVEVNGHEVKSNFKGLKHKPGTTRPADVTSMVRKSPNTKNTLSIAYSFTSKSFHVVLELVKKHTVEGLTDRVRKGNVISKNRVLREMVGKASDADIITTSTVMSLKDPISTRRIELPCRSSVCSHNQCFDVASFLQLQEQAPTWMCPVCNKTISLEGLAIDEYVQEILQSTLDSTDQVTIEPDGSWFLGTTRDSSSDATSPQDGSTAAHSSGRRCSPESEDVVEVSDYRLSNLKRKASTAGLRDSFSNGVPKIIRSTPLSSRGTSTPNSTANNRCNGSISKRQKYVIDLTLSDDETNDTVEHHSCSPRRT